MPVSTNTKARYITPAGKSLYARVQTPDTHFDANGLYHLDLLLEPQAAQGLIDRLTSALDDFMAQDSAVAAAKAKGRQVLEAPFYEEMQDGTYRFKFKQRAKITAKDGSVIDKHVAVFDSKVKPINKEIGNGSTVRVSYTINPYYTPSTRTAGVSLRLVGVQVLDLIEFGSDDCGFTAEDGYVSDDDETPSAVSGDFSNATDAPSAYEGNADF